MELPKRFTDKLDKINENGCQLWLAGKDKKGYGLFFFNGKTISSHIFAYEYFYETKVPEDDTVRIICGNHSCCNPEHIKVLNKRQLFESYIDRSGGEDACHPWISNIGAHGYGVFRLWDKMKRAHRLAWEYTNNMTIPEGMCVLHSCNNTICCNPKHLRLGTNAENSKQMVSDGRSSLGEKNGNAKLKDIQRREIRRLYKENPALSLTKIGETFGVSIQTVSRIIKNAAYSTSQNQ